MGKKEPVANRQYTGEFKVEAVRLAGSIGGNAAAKRLGIPQSTITNWVRRSTAGTLGEVEMAPAGQAAGLRAGGGERPIAPGAG